MSPDFERAFVAMSYVLGRRGAELWAPLGAPPATERLLAGLAHPDRSVRAQVLAPELARLRVALDRRRLG